MRTLIILGYIAISILSIVAFAMLLCLATGTPIVPPATSLPQTKSKIAPSDVAIYMVSTSHVGDYSSHSIAINSEYAADHGYRFQVFSDNATPDLPINFSKIQNALDILEGPNPPKYVVHIDADAVVVKPDYPITSIIGSYMGLSSMLIGEDCYNMKHCSKPGKVNSGVFIVKNDSLGRAILRKWLEGARGSCKRFVNQFPNCQLVFWNCVMLSHLRAHIKLVPYNLFNGTDGLFIQHMMQHSTNDRVEHFKKVRFDNVRWDPNTRMKVF